MPCRFFAPKSRPSVVFVLWAALCLPSGADAQSTSNEWYEVELLIFESKANAAERPVPQLNLEYPLDLVRFYEEPTEEHGPQLPRTQDIPYMRLDKTQGDLAERTRILNGNPAYRTLFHERWQQPVFSEGKAPWLLLQGGLAFGEYRELQGVIQLSRSRYLHLRTDLWLTRYSTDKCEGKQPLPPLPPLDPKDEAKRTRWQSFTKRDNVFIRKAANVVHNLNEELRRRSFDYSACSLMRLAEKRRVRSGEAHYLDHPAIGMLFRITPKR